MSLLAIVGPTASGKSTLARRIARARSDTRRPTEIVAIDAFTVYRGMDLGTAKPTPDERADVAHHLIDVLDPDEELSVAAFQRLARAAIDDILGRGATPLLVGGSGLYWRAVVDDLAFPPTDVEVRRRLLVDWAGDAAGAHDHLRGVDPDAAAKIDPGNLRRTVRALEVLELTGEPFSSFAGAWDDHASVYTDVDVVALDPPDADLRSAIRTRAEAMVDAGLLDEASALRARHQLSRTARQAIGYAEAFAVLDGAAPADGLVEAITTRTWRYARRQRSWFRRDPRCTPTPPDEVLASWT